VPRRGAHKPAMRPGGGRACIVMACSDLREADQVSRQLAELNTGYLITYRRGEDLMLNAPTRKVALVILATEDDPPALRIALRWLRHNWPRCPVTVVSDAGSGEEEMAAREGGAGFLTRPVSAGQWSSLLSHALRESRVQQPSTDA